MKAISGVWLVLFTVVVLASGCGSGGDGNTLWLPPDDKSTITINTESLASEPTSTTYTGDEDSNPSLGAGLMSSQSGTGMVIALIGRGADDLPVSWFWIGANGTSAGEYAVDLINGTFVSQIAGDPPLYSSQTGTITVTSVGGEGEHIQGSFDTIASVSSNTIASVSTGPTSTMRVWGTFSVKRSSDQVLPTLPVAQ